MNAVDVLQRIGETLGSTATVKSVFGEPIHVNGKTVVPVAKVTYGRRPMATHGGVEQAAPVRAPVNYLSAADTAAKTS
jgi:uncharacterized spore protein YtfJ